MSQKTTVDAKKVSELKDKARREQDKDTPNSGGNIQSVLYGSHHENRPASGGEFDA